MEIKYQHSLLGFNTFGIDEQCYAYADFKSTDELIELIQIAENQSKEFRVIGGGSNILLTQSVDALLGHNTIMGKSLEYEDEQFYYVRVAGGENWHEFVMWCVAQNYQGIENMALIPGSCGAAPIQNIGAYGCELKDYLYSLKALNINTKNIDEFKNEDCQFAYRNSIFKQSKKGQYIICSLLLKLNKIPQFKTSYGDIQSTLLAMNAQPTVENIARAVIQIRQSKLPDPSIIGNAGSFFKNPEIQADKYTYLSKQFTNMPAYLLENARYKIPAAWLIEQCGWKAYRDGRIGVHDKQALVLVNFGGAKGIDVYNLSERIIQSVEEKFDIVLEREVNIW